MIEEEDDTTSAIDPLETEGSSYNACIPLPDGITAKEGDSFDGEITGTVINKDGQLSVEVKTLNGETVVAAEEKEYTGTGADDVAKDSSEALDSFMKGRKVTQ